MTLTWAGFDELMAAMQQLPAHLVDVSTEIIERAADEAMAAIHDAYPEVTGNLKKGLKKETLAKGPYGVAFVIKNTAKHAWMYENGTQARWTHDRAYRGVMPPAHVFIPTAERRRARMNDELKAMLVAEGFLVG